MTRLLRMTALALLVPCLAASGQSPAPDFVQPPAAEAVRLVTWNIYRDSIFPEAGRAVDVADANRPAQFARVVRAVRPDVLCLQQVTVPSRRSAALLDQILPLGGDTKWQAFATADTVVLSRFALGARGGGVAGTDLPPRGYAMAVVDAPAGELFVVCAHFQSGDQPVDVAARRQQAGMVVKAIRDQRGGGSPAPLPPRTPFVILGDLNAIPGDTPFLDVLVSGGAAPTTDGGVEGLDWDGSALTDARPHHNVTGAETYTWRNDLDAYPPSALDRILYSDSVLQSLNQFVLDTTAMSYGQLTRWGMRSTDVMKDPQAGVHDHFPLVIDLAPRR